MLNIISSMSTIIILVFSILVSLGIVLVLGIIFFKPAAPVDKAIMASVPGNVIFVVNGPASANAAGFFNLVIDNKEPIKLHLRTPVGMDLDVGVHTVFVTYPRMGNEVYPASAQIDVQADKKYEVLYTTPITKLSSAKISIRIIQ